eukprot:TRINITY_DN189075_c0_g1_i3.p1 TRINITY_DN189075_c0_g1~~TRINITY_DN189075_c0_g1_i3.p1  ORF type:complete len:1530 (-),score=535.14 TRINITY_DN189075_c0_g1_i3:816-5405(-)
MSSTCIEHEVQLRQSKNSKIHPANFKYSPRSPPVLTNGEYNDLIHNIFVEEYPQEADVIHKLMEHFPSQEDPLLEALLIQMLGHNDPTFSDMAIKQLNCYYSGTSWELNDKLETIIAKTGDSFVISGKVGQHIRDTEQLVQVRALSFDKKSSDMVDTFHAIDCAKSGEFELKLESFTRGGFYDWKVVYWNGKEIQVPSSSPSGRYIVHPDRVTSKHFHESVVDLENAEVKRGNFVRGKFKDVEASLEGLKKYGVSSIYLLGALERDGKTTSSPQVCSSRISACKHSGGKEGLKSLGKRCSELDMDLILQFNMSVAACGFDRCYRSLLVETKDEDGVLVNHPGTDGVANEWKNQLLLNYRLKKTWDLSINEALALAEGQAGSKISGICLQEAQSAPIILESDFEELFRVDSNEKGHYSSSEIAAGSVVRRNRETGYWTSSLAKHYPNPFLVKMARSLWAKFPEFIIVGDSYWNRDSSLMRSGILPRDQSLLNVLSLMKGRSVEKDGTVNVLNDKDCASSFRSWLNQIPNLPQGGEHMRILASSGSRVPYPVLLLEQDAWCLADLVYFLPGMPMTFQDERTKAHRFDLPQEYAGFIREEHTRKRNEREYDDLDPRRKKASLPSVKSWKAGSSDMPPRIKSFDNFETLVSDDSGMKALESHARNKLGPQFGFDLNGLASHYENRWRLREEYVRGSCCGVKAMFTIVEDGEVISYDHERVLAFARFPNNEEDGKISQFTMHCTNINDAVSEISLHVDGYTELAQILSKNPKTVWTVKNLLDDDLEVALSAEELLAGGVHITLNPHSSAFFVCKTSSSSAKGLQNSAFIRMKNILRPHRPRGIEGVKCEIANGDQKPSDFVQFSLISSNFIVKELLRSVGEFIETKDPSMLASQLSDWSVSGEDNTLRADLILHTLTLICSQSSLEIKNSEMLALLGLVEKNECLKNVELHKLILKRNKLGPVVFCGPELGKWSRCGGLSVMVNELTETLAAFDQDIVCISPFYHVNRKGETDYLKDDDINYVGNVNIKIGDAHLEIGVHDGVYNGVRVIFLHHEGLFPKLYVGCSPREMLMKVLAFGNGSFEALKFLNIDPSVIVTNDWFCGPMAGLARGHFPEFDACKFIHICHNMDPSYEGRMYPSKHEINDCQFLTGLPRDFLVDPLWKQEVWNPSRCAFMCSDNWSTVSCSYRDELQTTSPLRPLLHRYPQPFAHANGIPVLLRRQKINMTHEEAKVYLQKTYFNGHVDDSIPLFAFVGRITAQKGVHLILDAAEELIQKSAGRIQLLIAGPASREEKYAADCADRMIYLHRTYPDCFWADPDLFFKDGAKCNRGADFTLMPSKFEPGGIVQHEFFVAGTPVVAHCTGGLKDSVIEFDSNTCKGGGFVFSPFNAHQYSLAVQRALAIFEDKEAYAVLRENAAEAVMDLSQVAWAWSKEFHRMCHVLTDEPTICFRFRSSSARIVHFTGDFCNNWTDRIPMNKVEGEDGLFAVSVKVPAGDHQYKFIVDGSHWIADPSMPTTTAGNDVNNVIHMPEILFE